MTQKLVTAQMSQPPSEPIAPDQSTSTDAASNLGAVHVLGFVVIWGTALWTVVRRRKNLPKDQTDSLQSNIPCPGCQFFSNNYYLKCAVRPSTAMTCSAINCSDYCPSKKPLKKLEWMSSTRRNVL